MKQLSDKFLLIEKLLLCLCVDKIKGDTRNMLGYMDISRKKYEFYKIFPNLKKSIGLNMLKKNI